MFLKNHKKGDQSFFVKGVRMGGGGGQQGKLNKGVHRRRGQKHCLQLIAVAYAGFFWADCSIHRTHKSAERRILKICASRHTKNALPVSVSS